MNEISEILNKLLKDNITITEKTLAAILKDISTILHMIRVESASGSFKEYSIVKANYYYSKVGEEIKK